MKHHAALASLLGAAALYRLALFLQYRATSVFYAVPAADGYLYDQWAREIAAGTFDPTGPYYLAPGYSYVVGYLYRYVAASPGIVYGVQLALGVLDIALVYRLARVAFGARVGLWAALLAALYAPFPFLELKLLSATIAVTSLLGSLALLADAYTRGRWWRWGAAGAALGITSLMRPEALLLAPFVVGWTLGWAHPPRRDGWMAPLVACVLVGGAWTATIAPVAIHNLRAGGGVAALVSAQGGIAFYQANNPRAKGFYVSLTEEGFSRTPTGQEREEQAIAERARGRPLSRAEVSRYWFGRGLAFITQEPGRFLWLLGQKLVKLTNSAEYSTDFVLSVERRTVWLLWLPGVPFALLLGLAFPGIVRRPLGPIGALVLFSGVANLLTVLMFYVSSRYRLAMVPALIVFAARTLELLRIEARAGPRRALATAAVVATVIAIGSRDWDGTGRHQEAGAYYTEGLAWAHRNAHDRAVTAHRRALAIVPARYDVAYALGVSLRARGERPAAAEAFADAVRLNAEYFEGHLGLGVIREETGDLAGARAAYEDARRLRPDDPAIVEAFARLARAAPR